MSDKKYTFGQPSLMKAIEPGQKASIKFLDHPKLVETEWGEKYSVTILLLSHPLYSISSPRQRPFTATMYSLRCSTVENFPPVPHIALSPVAMPS